MPDLGCDMIGGVFLHDVWLGVRSWALERHEFFSFRSLQGHPDLTFRQGLREYQL